MRIAPSLALVIAATTVSHAGKPRLLVVSVDADKTQDAQVKTARDITLALRAKAKASGAFLVVAPDDKAFADERVKHKCVFDAPSCVREVAAAFKADAIVWGQLDTDLVTLKALRAGKDDVIVVTGAPPADTEAAEFARAAYDTLLVPSGTLVVQANVASAIVTIDGADKLALVNSSVQRVLAEGQHKLKIEAPGYAPLSTTVAIKESETATISVELVPLPAK
jgi:hypothetical protein